MKLFKLPFIMVIVLINTIPTSSQEIATDNSGKPIFKIPNSAKLSPEIALNNLGLEYTPFNLRRRIYYVMEDGAKYYTMHKSTAINIGLNIVDNEEDILLVGKDMDIAPHFEIGVSRGIDKLINPSKINSYYTIYGAVFVDHQKFDLYDTIQKSFMDEKFKRWSYGAKLSFNKFRGTSSAWAINLSYSNSILTDDHIRFQDRRSNTVYIDNNIVTNGDDDGYLSPMMPSDNFRLAVAHPFFLRIPLAIIPYYFVKFGNTKPKHNAGLLFTILNEGFRGFEGPGKVYKFETAFSVGLNFISTGTSKKNYIFLSGTITIGSSKADDEKDKQDQKKAF